MGADWLRLFDKKLCDEIVCLSTDTLPAFVERHLGRLGEFSMFRLDFGNTAVQDRVQRLLEGGNTEARLREALVDELCFDRQMISLDYWGCYVEVFAAADPPGAISDYRFFPERQQQSFLLLMPEHVDRILESLDLHRAELTVMTDADVNVVRQWRDMCTADRSQMVAYVFDA